MAPGRGTAPRLPDGELALDGKTLERLLECLGPGMVLVGGQALAFWMDRFGIRTDGMAVTSDGDALGDLSQATAMAHLLQGQVLRPDTRRLTALVAQVRLGFGLRQRNIDVLHQLYTISGRAKSREFTQQVRRRQAGEQAPDRPRAAGARTATGAGAGGPAQAVSCVGRRFYALSDVPDRHRGCRMGIEPRPLPHSVGRTWAQWPISLSRTQP